MNSRMRIGTGFDFHPFEVDRKLILGGVQIPHTLGLKGHSDADVLSHAVADALLGAAALGDIGSYFPDTDPRYHDISSLLILEKVYQLIRWKGFAIANIDTVVIAEEPLISPYMEAIKTNLARVLHLSSGEVGMKATTMEGCGPIGRCEGLAAQVVVLLFLEE